MIKSGNTWAVNDVKSGNRYGYARGNACGSRLELPHVSCVDRFSCHALAPEVRLGCSLQRRMEFIAKRQSKAVRGHLSNTSCGGSRTKVYGAIMEVFADVVAPLTLTMAKALESNVCFFPPCRTQITRKTRSTSPGTVRGPTRATRKTHRTVQTGSRDGYKDNTGDVQSTQNMYLFRFIGDKTPE